MANPNPHQAIEINRQRGAERALEDPVKLDRAARLIRLAIARGKMKAADLEPAGQPERRAS